MSRPPLKMVFYLPLQNVSAVVLYGLKQAPRVWFERFVSVIRAAGFSPSEYDSALFIHHSLRGLTLLLLYVDYGR